MDGDEGAEHGQVLLLLLLLLLLSVPSSARDAKEEDAPSPAAPNRRVCPSLFGLGQKVAMMFWSIT